MTTKDAGSGFFGRNPFDNDTRKKFREEWSKMTDSEKLDFMNKRMEHMGEDRFSVEFIDARCEEWMKKTTEEKEAFINERKKAFKERFSHPGGLFGHGRFGFGFGPREREEGSSGDCFL